jgi:hypothetical protein
MGRARSTLGGSSPPWWSSPASPFHLFSPTQISYDQVLARCQSLVEGACFLPLRSHSITRRAPRAYHILIPFHLGWSMAQSLRTRPRLSRMTPNLTKEATRFVCAASCNNNATRLNDFSFPSCDSSGKPSALRRASYTLASGCLVPDGMFECSVR